MENINNEKQELNLLCAKIGAFFSNCDGNFSEEEKNFLEKYLKLVDTNLTPDDNHQLSIEDVMSFNSTIEEIISETNKFLSRYEDNERIAVSGMLTALIDQIIKVDGEEHPNEIAYLEQWKKEVL
jgi:hypothetical protein